MPIYRYECKKCEHIFEKTLPMKDSARKVRCIKCRCATIKLIPTSISFMGNEQRRGSDAFQAGYNPALGEHCTGRKDFESKMRAKGLTCVGNEEVKQNSDLPSSVFDDKIIKEFHDAGIKVSDNYAEKLKKKEVNACEKSKD